MKKHKLSTPVQTGSSKGTTEVFVLPPELLAKLGINLGVQSSEISRGSDQKFNISPNLIQESQKTSSIIETANLMKESVFLSPTFHLQNPGTNVTHDENEQTISMSKPLTNNENIPKDNSEHSFFTREKNNYETGSQSKNENVAISNTKDHLANIESNEMIEEYIIENQNGSSNLTDVSHYDSSKAKNSNEKVKVVSVDEHTDEAYLSDYSNGHSGCSSEGIQAEETKQRLARNNIESDEVVEDQSQLIEIQDLLSPNTTNYIMNEVEDIDRDLNITLNDKQTEIIFLDETAVDQSIVISNTYDTETNNKLKDFSVEVSQVCAPGVNGDNSNLQNDSDLQVNNCQNMQTQHDKLTKYTLDCTPFTENIESVNGTNNDVLNDTDKPPDNTLLLNIRNSTQGSSCNQNFVNTLTNGTTIISSVINCENDISNKQDTLSTKMSTNITHDELNEKSIDYAETEMNRLNDQDKMKEIATCLKQIEDEGKQFLPMDDNTEYQILSKTKTDPIKSKLRIQGVEKPGGNSTDNENIVFERNKDIKTYRRNTINKIIPTILPIPENVTDSNIYQLSYTDNKQGIKIAALIKHIEFCICYDFGSLAYYDCEMLYEHIHFWDRNNLKCNPEILYSIYNEDSSVPKQITNFVEDDNVIHCDIEPFQDNICWNYLMSNNEKNELGFSDTEISKQVNSFCGTKTRSKDIQRKSCSTIESINTKEVSDNTSKMVQTRKRSSNTVNNDHINESSPKKRIKSEERNQLMSTAQSKLCQTKIEHSVYASKSVKETKNNSNTSSNNLNSTKSTRRSTRNSNSSELDLSVFNISQKSKKEPKSTQNDLLCSKTKSNTKSPSKPSRKSHDVTKDDAVKTRRSSNIVKDETKSPPKPVSSNKITDCSSRKPVDTTKTSEPLRPKRNTSVKIGNDDSMALSKSLTSSTAADSRNKTSVDTMKHTSELSKSKRNTSTKTENVNTTTLSKTLTSSKSTESTNKKTFDSSNKSFEISRPNRNISTKIENDDSKTSPKTLTSSKSAVSTNRKSIDSRNKSNEISRPTRKNTSTKVEKDDTKTSPKTLTSSKTADSNNRKFIDSKNKSSRLNKNTSSKTENDDTTTSFNTLTSRKSTDSAIRKSIDSRNKSLEPSTPKRNSSKTDNEDTTISSRILTSSKSTNSAISKSIDSRNKSLEASRPKRNTAKMENDGTAISPQILTSSKSTDSAITKSIDSGNNSSEPSRSRRNTSKTSNDDITSFKTLTSSESADFSNKEPATIIKHSFELSRPSTRTSNMEIKKYGSSKNRTKKDKTITSETTSNIEIDSTKASTDISTNLHVNSTFENKKDSNSSKYKKVSSDSTITCSINNEILLATPTKQKDGVVTKVQKSNLVGEAKNLKLSKSNEDSADAATPMKKIREFKHDESLKKMSSETLKSSIKTSKTKTIDSSTIASISSNDSNPEEAEKSKTSKRKRVRAPSNDESADLITSTKPKMSKTEVPSNTASESLNNATFDKSSQISTVASIEHEKSTTTPSKNKKLKSTCVSTNSNLTESSGPTESIGKFTEPAVHSKVDRKSEISNQNDKDTTDPVIDLSSKETEKITEISTLSGSTQVLKPSESLVAKTLLTNLPDENASDISKETSDLPKCGVCEKNVAETDWLDHISKEHNYLAWREGEPELDLEDNVTLKQHLQSIVKQNNGLVCSKCGLVRKFAQSFLKHIEKCDGKSADSTLEWDDDSPLSVIKAKKSTKKKLIDKPPLTCGVCNQTVEHQNWIKHIRVEHNYMAWKAEETPLDLSDVVEVKEHLKYISKYYGPLICNECGAKYTYVKKYLRHAKTCGKYSRAATPEPPKIEKEIGPKVTCGVCKDSVGRGSWIKHIQQKHDYLAWVDGETPIDIQDRDQVTEQLDNILSMTGVLVCSYCGIKRKYRKSFEQHLTACKKTGFRMEIVQPETSDKEKFECGVCHEKGDRTKWKEHVMDKHYNIAWKAGELPINYRNPYAVEKYLKEYQRLYGLVCKNCKSTRTSCYGFYAHIMTCGKSEAELDPVHDYCDICKNKYLCIYKNQHMAMHRDQEVRKERRELKALQAAQDAEKMKQETLNTTGKRKAARKAQKIIEKHAANVVDGKIVCSCGTTFDTAEEISQHRCQCSEDNDCEERDVSVKMEMLSEEEDSDSDFDSNISSQEEEIEISRKKKKKRSRDSKIVRLSYKVLNYLSYIGKSYKNFCDLHLTSSSLFYLWRDSGYEVVLKKKMDRYNPTVMESCKVRLGQFGEEWMTYKRFESKKNRGYILFAGGTIQCISWVPHNIDDETHSNYLAVSTHRGSDVPRFGPDELPVGPGLIQIWDFKQFNFLPKYVLGLAHDYGIVWSMDWCPSGARDLLPNGCSEEEIPMFRLGLLAIACSNGSAYIFAVPYPPETHSDEQVMYKLKPVAELRFSMSLKRRIYQATSICWSPQKGHNIILVGYSDGSTALYDLATESRLLTTVENDVTIFFPFQDRISENSSITGVSICPTMNESYSIGGHCSGSATGGTMSNWPYNSPSVRSNLPISNCYYAAQWPTVTLTGDAQFTAKSVTEMEWWGGGRRLGGARSSAACARCARVVAAAAPCVRLLRTHPCYSEVKKQIIATLLMVPLVQSRQRKVNDDLSVVVEPLTYDDAIAKYGLQLSMISKRQQLEAQKVCSENELTPDRFPLSDIVATAFCPAMRFHEKLTLATHAGIIFVING